MRRLAGQVMVNQEGVTTPLIHFACHTGEVKLLRGQVVPVAMVACQPERQNLSGWYRTNNADVVNCPECRKTEKYRAAAARGKP